MTELLDELKRRCNRITDLMHSSAILEWDQETYLPDGSHQARAHQITTLRTLAHEAATDVQLGQLLDKLESKAFSGDWDADLVRVCKRDYRKATKLSTDLVARIAETESLAKDAWRRAKEDNDYPAFAPFLERLVNLNIEKAESLGYSDRPYDALLDQFEEGLKTSTVERVFGELRDELVPIVDKLSTAAPISEDLIRGHFEPDRQWLASRDIATRIGYDFTRGRLDPSSHPFSTAFSVNDVRITTRVDPTFFSPAFYGTLHEVGHALYEQGIDPAFERTPLADGTSLGIHESQSRLWENLVGRSEAFINYYFRTLQTFFPDALGAAGPGDFYRAVNAVRPSLIRVEADEVTYNLHVMIRFELECDLIAGRLGVRDLPDAWNELYRRYLGVVPSSDSDGVLQDIHWSMGAFGYFPTYTLGNILSCQFYDRADEAIGGISALVAVGQFEPLLSWLRANIHRFGRSRTADELVESITGGGISATNWLDYIRRKYGSLYDVELEP